jgi:glutamine amidotransferase
MSKVVIVDYGMGNLRSVKRKIIRFGVDAQVTNDPNVIKNASKLILPGVGHFAKGIENLKNSGIYNILNEKVLIERIPILGICLGMQIMAKNSQEGDSSGLGWFNADIVKFKVQNNLKYKVPHIGWNNISKKKDSILFKGIKKDSMFYFVHSFHIACQDKQDILTTTEYEYSFTSSIQKDNIYGTQFHPEKSHDCGELILKNFIEL